MWVLAGALVVGCNEPTGALSLPAAVGRPDDVSKGPRVGVIVAVKGHATIMPSKGKAFPGLPDQQLLRDDRLTTAADSFVVVQLHNGHLVRLGASQNIVVEMLAPFHDPPAGEDVEDRFVRLLTPEERNNPALSGAITRVAGWNTRMSASQSFAPLQTQELASEQAKPDGAASVASPAMQGDVPPPPAAEVPLDGIKEEASRAEKKERPRADTKGPAAPSRTQSPQKPADESKASPETEDVPVSGKGSASPGNGAGGGAGDVPPPAQQPKPAPEAPSAPHLPSKIAFRPASGGQAHTELLPEPLRSGGAALAACAGAGAKISGTIKGGKLATLKVDGKVLCQTLVGKASTLPDGTFELTVLQ